MGNANLTSAKRAKNDEFYTRMPDIENELRHYSEHFKGRTVLCNCDDPYESNFFRYFALNFNHLGLKKLMATSYCGSPIAGAEYQPSLFGDEPDAPSRHAYKAIVTHVEDTTGDGGFDMEDVKALLNAPGNEVAELHGDGEYGAGDFRSRECLELLDEADIVVTNPPFSLFREYVATLMDYGKGFVVLGNKNAVTYKEIFPLLRDDKVWLGFTSPSDFTVPGEGTTKKVNGLCRWYINLDITKRHEDLLLYRRYKGHETDYPKYDNYDAIEVSKVADIPEDYYGVMGVPITFMDKYNPDQFDIVAFRKGDDGRDLVFTREREREYNRTFAYSSGDGDSRAVQQSEGHDGQRQIEVRPHHHTPQTEPIDRDHPIATNLANGLVNDCTIKGRKTYVRILIRRKEASN
ncbi:adenine-specific methyltransferase EcoRI family protein [Bifidobacterium adolescentis]|uniref:adenine-specific methyltransferase EcoRI family protein n=1 Tax=Bifidobacterium adolescentis TaxID=1680 RepID=UPI0009BD4C6D|nr:adenine-specific methyltransferase EcoRI family protein [Bifidobacterium adolescentis]